jgi:L1 cell adhesion molecule like protein
MQGKGDVAIGIDLGTTFSCIAVFKNNKIEIIPNEMGDSTTPSIITFSGDKIYAGEETLRIQTKDPKNTIYGVKRLIGRYYEDKEVQEEIKKYWTFKVEPGEQQEKGHLPLVVVDYEGKKQKFSPEQISSLVLSKLKKSAERHLKTEVNKCVVTIPAHFREAQKNATIKACQNAGFTVLGTLNEPEAAALAFGFEGKKVNPKKNEIPRDEKNILIFDLGGGTFDVSVLELKDLVFTDKGKFGDPHFGGEDFDNALVDFCIDKFYEMKKIKIDKNNDPEPMKRLKMSCENAKKILSSREVTQIELNCLKDNEDFSIEITRDLFENICGHLFDKCISPIYDLLNNIGISAGAIDDIVLIGGSTRIPRIRKMIKNIFFQEPNTSINPDEAVAYGAAILAAKLSGLENNNTNILTALS